MYLKELYHHHKGWFIIVILFIVAQLVNNIKQDIAISPIYAYGMYSAYIPLSNSQHVFEINVNGETLQPRDFSPQQWDKITLPLEYYCTRENNRKMYSRDIKRLLHHFGITADSSKFTYSFDQDHFLNSYRSLLPGKKIDSLSIIYSSYKFDSSFRKIQSAPFTETCK
jgi:hypothetical protein